jgi:peptidoglycan/xylan/chitin deacetylase (PgdA/CDA1 family)
MMSDHLKSTSALVARNGVLNVKYFYFPYGARRGVPFNSITAKRFTGQYHEASLPGGEGLSFYNARWYDPWFDDPYDQAAIRVGIELYDKYGLNVSITEFMGTFDSSAYLLPRFGPASGEGSSEFGPFTGGR